MVSSVWGADDNVVEGNSIGLSADGAALYNGGYAVLIDPGSSGNTNVDNSVPSSGGTTTSTTTTTHSTTGTPIPATFNIASN